MGLSIKKYIYRFLCSRFTGSLIYILFSNKIPDLRWGNFRFSVPVKSVRKSIVASIFWGFYESSEIRFVEKYLRNDLCVIELGSSIGIVSSHIAFKLTNGAHFICVEANPYLIETIKENVSRHRNKNISFEVLNNAVSYDGEEVMISISNDNTETSVLGSARNANVSVKTVSFETLVKRSRDRKYALVCDIEGSELEMLLRESDSFKLCSQLFIELHETMAGDVLYSIEMLKEIIIKKHGFQLEEEHGPVAYFSK